MGLHFLYLQVHGRFKCVHGHPNVELSMDKSPVVKTTASTSMDKSPLVKTTASTSTVHGQSPWTDHGQSRGPRTLEPDFFLSDLERMEISRFPGWSKVEKGGVG